MTLRFPMRALFNTPAIPSLFQILPNSTTLKFVSLLLIPLLCHFFSSPIIVMRLLLFNTP
ncbi:CLUMA_CG010158, isoform A [Clunio marinus]|uniref:CLUMA_CG010158, isoform A n=1 Tax=Clunio marinus TaxID=568069 RepID=A0A1J1I882_9DIPT|nr:CLUMA_CG010158, isoform A [Clunio marinus]